MKQRRKRMGMLLAFPVLAGTGVFFVFPMLETVRLSLANVPGAGGWRNYRAVFESPTYRLALWNTVKFMLLAIPLILLVSLWTASVFQRAGGKRMVLQMVLLFPMIIPTGALVTFIRSFLNNQGILNQALVKLGFAPVNWLESGTAFWILILLYVWKYFGYDFILIMAGINMIPGEQEESAKLEGASVRKFYRYILLPQLLPVLAFAAVVSVVNFFKIYREAFLLGGKRPAREIYFLQHFLNNNFENLNYQRLSVAAVSSSLLIFMSVGIVLLVRKGIGAAHEKTEKK